MNLGKIHDFIKMGFDFFAGHPQNGTVQENVFPAG